MNRNHFYADEVEPVDLSDGEHLSLNGSVIEADHDPVAVQDLIVDTTNEAFLYNTAMTEFVATEGPSMSAISFDVATYEWEPQEEDAPHENAQEKRQESAQMVVIIPDEEVFSINEHQDDPYNAHDMDGYSDY